MKSDFKTNKKKGFETKCDECGQKAIVPFKPISGRKVYCKDCFSKKQSYNSTQSINYVFNSNFAWARRGKKFSGKRDRKPRSIFVNT
ncbi:hypothetical protein E2P47_02780 [Candidatus Bathyarchaeota archaeon]|nr:hypothetical protein E2P47_02780 [Candidatus Bathyarchaeota archaeon]